MPDARGKIVAGQGKRGWGRTLLAGLVSTVMLASTAVAAVTVGTQTALASVQSRRLVAATVGGSVRRQAR